MSRNGEFDPQRSAAIREMLGAVVDGDVPTRGLRSRIGFIIALVTAAALLSGGGAALALTGRIPFAQGPVASATATPTPNPSSTPSGSAITAEPAPVPAVPTPASTPTPGPTSIPMSDDPNDPTTWPILSNSVGPVALGANARETLLAAGFTASPPNGCVTLFHWYSHDPDDLESTGYGITVGVDESGPGVRYIRIETQSADQSVPTTPLATFDGVGAGSTAAELAAAYPGLTKTVDTWEERLGGYREYVAGPIDGGYLHFDTRGGAADQDVVWAIVVNDTAGEQAVCP